MKSFLAALLLLVIFASAQGSHVRSRHARTHHESNVFAPSSLVVAPRENVVDSHASSRLSKTVKTVQNKNETYEEQQERLGNSVFPTTAAATFSMQRTLSQQQQQHAL
jgi:hypothetical protein